MANLSSEIMTHNNNNNIEKDIILSVTQATRKKIPNNNIIIICLQCEANLIVRHYSNQGHPSKCFANLPIAFEC